jgi:hypothetical protein
MLWLTDRMSKILFQDAAIVISDSFLENRYAKSVPNRVAKLLNSA